MLKLRRVAIDTYSENVALLARRCSVYRPEEFQALKKIQIDTGTGRLMASLVIADDNNIVGPDELGLSQRTFDRLGLPAGSPVTIAPVAHPASMEAVRAKIAGATLGASAIKSIVEDIAAHRYSEMEIAAFLIGYASYMTSEEMLALTKAMAGAGNRITWPQPTVVDKHCIGGIPGNRTSMVVVPIVAAHGLTIPKTSSRAITSPAGTADTMEVLARVDLSIEEMKAVVAEQNGCLVWGGHVNLSPADDILISVERPLRVDTREQMVASILSKKLAAGSTHLLLDIPVGSSAKVRTTKEAMRLRKLFEYVGDRVGPDLRIVVTDACEPVGRGIGPVLEARDVMAVMNCEQGAPIDLREKSLQIAGRILDFDPALRGGSGYERAEHLLESGAAADRLNAIIESQGRSKQDYELGDKVQDVCANSDGIVESIDCYQMGRIARLAGAPIDKGAGIDLFKKVGDTVEVGEPLYRIHACVQSDFDFATSLACETHGYLIRNGIS